MAVTGDNSLFFSTGLDNSGLKKGSFDAVGIVQGMANRISKTNPFAAMAIGAVAALGVISKAAYDMAQEYETAMKEVQTISAATQKDYEKISKSVFQLSHISTDKPVQLAKAYYQIVSAGYDGAKGLALLEVATKAAVGGITDTETAADGLTTVLNAFKLEAEDSEKVADILFQTVKLGKTTFSELAANMSTVAPIAAASGVSFEQVAAAIASLTKQGVPTAQAMTQIRSAIIGANEALGDGWSKTMSLQEAFQLLYDKAGGSQTKLQELVGRVEAVSGVLGVAGRNAKGAAADLSAMATASGESAKAFSTMINTNENQWKLFGNNIKGTVKDLGDGVLVVSSVLARGLNSLFDTSEDLLKITIEQRAEYQSLKAELDDVNIGFERKREILELLKTTYPKYLESLELDELTNENLSDALRLVKGDLEDINKLHLRRIELSAYNEDVNVAKRNLDKITNSYEDAEANWRKVLKRIREFAADPKNNIEIEFSPADDPQEILLKIEKAFESFNPFGDTNELVLDADDAFTSLFLLAPKVEKATKEFNKQNDALTEAEIRLGNTEAGYKDIIIQIEKIQNVEDLDFFKINFDKTEIVDAIKLKENTLTTLSEIDAITKAAFKKNPKILADYLNSENKEIKAAAEKRKAYLTFKPTKDNDDDSFEKTLRNKKEQYKAYQLALQNNDNEFAQKLKKEYKLQEGNYVEYLRKLYDEKVKHNEKVEILNALESEQSGLVDRKTTTPIEVHLPTRANIIVGLTIDEESIDIIQKKIELFTIEHNQAQSDAERKLIADKIHAEEEKLKAAKAHLNGEEDLYKDLQRTAANLSLKELKQRIADKKKELTIKLRDEKKYAKEILKLKGEIEEAEDAIAGKTQQTIGDIVAVLGEASDLFAKFGNEDMAQLLGQLGGVAEGVGSIATGIATGNPLDVIEGSLKVLNSAITVEISSDTAKFEKEIDRLATVLNRLARDINDAIGIDKIDLRLDALKEESALLQANKDALQAEIKARKEIKILGTTIAKKGSGSGTDEAKIKEFDDAIDELGHKLKNLQVEIYEILTTTTHDSITDSIAEGFKNGKSSIEDFAGTFEDLMRKAIFESFKLSYLEDLTSGFFTEFGELAESDQTLTPEEIATLRTTFNNLIETSKREMEAFDQILSDAGISGGLFGENSTPQNNGLSGAIRRELTEETGSELAGLMRRIADDVRGGLNNGKAAVENLILIQSNTFNTVTELKLAVKELQSISENTKAHYLFDLSN